MRQAVTEVAGRRAGLRDRLGVRESERAGVGLRGQNTPSAAVDVSVSGERMRRTGSVATNVPALGRQSRDVIEVLFVVHGRPEFSP